MKLSRLPILFFIPLLFYVFIKGHYTFLIFTEIIVCLSVYEFYDILLKKGKNLYMLAGIFISSIIPISLFFKIFEAQEIIMISLLILAILQILNNSIKNATEKLSLTFFGIVYIALLFSYIIKIKQLDNGGLLVSIVFFQIWACDTLAYIFGITFGKHKFSKISPNKSIEGLIGGFIGVYLITIFSKNIIIFMAKLTNTYLIMKFPPIFSIKNVVFALLITIFCVFGDLFESKFKREYNVKDSGNILLGHGGFLDRFDSALFVIPLSYYLISYSM